MVIGHPSAPAAQPPRWLPYALGVAGLGGLLTTFLPMWTTGLPSLRGTIIALWFGIGFGGSATSANDVQINVGFYDWIASGRPVVAVAPLVFALTLSVAVASVLSGPDRMLVGVTAAAAISALIILGATAIHPRSAREVTGPLAEQMSRRDLALITNSGQTDVHLGIGLILAVVVLALVAVLAAWQYFSAASRRAS